MSTFFDQPLGAMLASPSGEKVAPEAEAVVARMAQMAFDVATSVGKGELLRALATSSPSAFLGVFAELLATVSSPSAGTIDALRGRLSLAEALERTGGLWRSDEAQGALSVSRATLQAWRDGGRVLALPLGDGSFGYPVAQFLPPTSDIERPRAHPAMAGILRAAGETLGAQELFLILSAPQPALGGPDGAPRTGFQAMRAGDAELVQALVTHLVTPADQGAPPADDEPAVLEAAYR